MIDWDATRAAYVQRFGALFDARESPEGPGAPFWLLSFWQPDTPAAQVVYASFGAPTGDVFLVSALPSYALSQAAEQAARSCPPSVAPPALLRVGTPWSTFSGLLLAPRGGRELRGRGTGWLAAAGVSSRPAHGGRAQRGCARPRQGAP